ncbi:hypothetical protein EMIT0P258_10459 [Pseudomonas sp. IT-P258]
MAPSKSLHPLCIRWKNAGGRKQQIKRSQPAAAPTGITLTRVGVAAGCDLFLPFALPGVTRRTQSDNVRLSIAAGMLGPQLHGRLL